MRSTSFQLTPVQEHRFWVEVLEDHAHFVRDHLSSEETAWIEWAEKYIDMFWKLRVTLSKIKPTEPIGSSVMKAAAKEIHPVAYGYYRLEGQLQHLKLEGKVQINLSPSYFNGTLNENQEYLRQLNDYMQGRRPKPLPLAELMEMWLEDQLVHAELLHNTMKMINPDIAERAHQISQEANAHILQNQAIRSYLRFTPSGFPRQIEHALDTAKSVIGLHSLVAHTIETHKSHLPQGTLRLLEHYLPETCYFLHKLSEYVPETCQLPNCPISRSELAGIV